MCALGVHEVWWLKGNAASGIVDGCCWEEGIGRLSQDLTS